MEPPVPSIPRLEGMQPSAATELVSMMNQAALLAQVSALADQVLKLRSQLENRTYEELMAEFKIELDARAAHYSEMLNRNVEALRAGQ